MQNKKLEEESWIEGRISHYAEKKIIIAIITIIILATI